MSAEFGGAEVTPLPKEIRTDQNWTTSSNVSDMSDRPSNVGDTLPQIQGKARPEYGFQRSQKLVEDVPVASMSDKSGSDERRGKHESTTTETVSGGASEIVPARATERSDTQRTADTPGNDIGDGLQFDPDEDIFARVKAYNASEEINPRGQLGMTAEHHHMLAEYPPDHLVENPGATEADLMTDEQLSEQLAKDSATVQKLQQDSEGSDFVRSYLAAKQQEHAGNIAYLTRIGRLPEGFNTEENHAPSNKPTTDSTQPETQAASTEPTRSRWNIFRRGNQ